MESDISLSDCDKNQELLVLPPEWRRGWLKEKPWEKIFALKGQVFREKDGRRTLRFAYRGKGYFAKLHSPYGLRRLLRRLSRLQKPESGAEAEWRAIKLLSELKVATTPLVAYGRRGQIPWLRFSFIITEEITNAPSLEDFCRHWAREKPPPRLKRALIKRVAEITGTMHRAGINHNDLYICHFLLQLENSRIADPDQPMLYLIDLHRVHQQARLDRRRLIKDLAALHFSSLDIGLTRRDRLRFIETYRRQSWRQALSDDPGLWQRIENKARRLYSEYQQRTSY